MNYKFIYRLLTLHWNNMPLGWRGQNVGLSLRDFARFGLCCRRGIHVSQTHFVCNFYAPGLKGPPGASSVWIVRPSVCLSVRLSVRNSVPLTFKVQYLKFGWLYSNQTWTVSSSKGSSHFTDITCPWGWGGVKIWDLEILPYFDFVAAGGIRVSQTHV